MRWLEHIFSHLSSISSAHPNETLACENEQRAFLPSCDAGWVRVLALEDAEVLAQQQDIDVLVISKRPTIVMRSSTNDKTVSQAEA